ncbi:PucR family transcriptional regulator [Candidatus Formimonas warabiya]|uniref:PucR C-terminal helix-turn-helix domain-containing protein n=1 Tax=Formimonas warabiya TaxID=1761012 RepID=A0A3G1KXX1_FORW1|nr:helix-turn-helix domain-containing protein [Candidatus Formimonas warabiya]ATW27209.1 hypothetical protein DCMF_22830 [Candidatus Formimonas warabiya]
MNDDKKERIIQIAKKGANLFEICRVVADQLGGEIFILNSHFQLLASSKPDRMQGENLPWDYQELWQEGVLSSLHYRDEPVHISRHNDHLVLLPITAHTGRMEGVLCALLHPPLHPCTQSTLDLLKLVALILSLRWGWEKETILVKQKRNTEVMRQLIFGQISREEILHLEREGLTIPKTGAIIIVHLIYDNNGGKMGKEDLSSVENSWINFALQCISNSTSYAQAFAFENHNELVILIDGNKAQALAEDLFTAVQKKMPGYCFIVGVGGIKTDLSYFYESYLEAHLAIDNNFQLVRNQSGVYHCESLGAYKVLGQIPKNQEIQEYIDQYLGSVILHDKEKGPSLMPTLYSFFRCDCNINRVADNLFLHRNTVKYRLGKVEELTKLSLDKTEDLFNLLLALKLHRFMTSGFPAFLDY